MKKRKLLALCLVPALLAGCAAPAGVTDLSRQFEAGDPAPPEADPAADAAIGSLGAELLRAAREPGENTLLSPLSVALALSMTANGAAEDTLAEFEALLGADVAALNANAASLLADYAALGAPRSAPSPTACGWTGGWRPTNYFSPGVRRSMGPGSIRPIWTPTRPAGR